MIPAEFRLDVRRGGDAVAIAVSGELHLATSPALELELQRAESSGTTLAIIDLSDLQFIDSSGLNVVVSAHQRAGADGRRFALVSGPQQAQQVMRMTGVAELLTVAETLEEPLGER